MLVVVELLRDKTGVERSLLELYLKLVGVVLIDDNDDSYRSTSAAACGYGHDERTTT